MELTYRPFSLSLREPLSTSRGPIETREGYLVRVSDGDRIGVGEATPLSGWTESNTSCANALEAVADAIEEGDTEGAVAACRGAPAARHGVTLAILDRRARELDRPLYRHLQAPGLVARVGLNATVGANDPETAAKRARTVVERGFRCVKVKAGDDLETVRERLEQIRAAVGEDVRLRVDANGAWSRTEASRAIEMASRFGVTLLEQPLESSDLAGHADLRGRGVEIGLDESLVEHGIDDIIAADAADAIVCKPMALGGVDMALEVATWGTQAGIDPIVSTTIDGVVARTAAVHLAASIRSDRAHGLATGTLLANDLDVDPVPIEKGNAVVPQSKGHGVENAWSDE